MSATKTDLIHRTLRNLGALPQGQSPSAEESQSLSDLIDAMVADLNARDVVYISDSNNLKDEWLIPLGHILAWTAAPEFGAANDQALAALATQAEMRLKHIESIRPTREILKADYF